MSCLVPVFPLWTPCSDNADYVGWVMFAVWRMVAYQKTSSTVSWHWGGEPLAALTCDIKMSAQEIWRLSASTLCWEGLAADRTGWRSALKQHLKTGEDKLMTAAADKRARRKEGSSSIRPTTTHICVICNKNCHSHIETFSHKRRCYNPATN